MTSMIEVIPWSRVFTSEMSLSPPQVVEQLSLPSALKLVSACCGEELQESHKAAVQVSPIRTRGST